MDKTELIERIDKIPLFVKDRLNVDRAGEQTEQRNHFAICEEDNPQAVCTVSKRYQLVQFHSVFKPVVEQFSDMSGQILYYFGSAVMDIFPKGDEHKDVYQEGDNRFGLTIANSVDKSSAVSIRFSVMYDVEGKTRTITIPKSVAGFRRTHSTKMLLSMTQTYSTTIVKVKDYWRDIVTKFPAFELEPDTFKNLLEEMDFTDTMSRTLKYKCATKMATVGKYTLWDFFNDAINFVNSGNYRSGVHMRNKLDAIVDKIMTYSFTLSI